jgi:TonB-dependent starch-binding outer membrane protein SusC
MNKDFTVHRMMLLFCLVTILLTYVQPGRAQNQPVAKLNSSNAHRKVEVSLEEVLVKLQKNYNVAFLYESDLVSEKTIAEDIREDQSLEEILKSILDPFHMKFTKINETSYAISLNSEANSKEIKANLRSQPPPEEDMLVKVSGTVLDETQRPIPGANVVVKGTTVGTSTDVEGRYSMETSEDATLVFSFIGYITQEIRVGNQTLIDVSLAPDVMQLAEVVVVGASIKKTDLTGAVSALDGEKLTEIPTTSITQAMSGRMSGVLIQNSSGVSGGASIQIRGNNSIQFGTNPIFVVDGLVIEGGFNLINPNDIESINVLKDASSTAIYGSRGANGVVLVTTKKGKRNQGRVNYDAWVGIQEFSKIMPRLGAQDIFNLRVDAFANAFIDNNPTINRQGYIDNIILNKDLDFAFAEYELETIESGKSYNWLDEVTRSGTQQNHSISASKGTDDGSYYLSFNYANNKGLMKNSDYTRITGRLNLEQNIKPWLKFGSNTTFARSHETYVQGSVFSIANGANPLLPINNEINYLKWSGMEVIDDYNPIRSLRIDGDGYQTRLLSSNYVNIKPIENLNLRSTLSVDLMDQKDLWYAPRDIGQSVRNSTDGTAQQRNDHWVNWQWENTASFDALQGDHNLNILGGFSMMQNKWDYNQVDALGFASDDFSYRNIGSSYLRERTGLNSDFTTNSLMSYIGRANYSFKEKYFATVTARYDGSSRFGDGNKWGLFPSVALGWTFTEESFFKNLNLTFIDFAKLRTGYGIAGNQNIPNFAYRTLYSPQFSNGSTTYVSTGRLGNPGLVWEKQKQLNAGIDLTFLNHALNVSVDYFTINNEDLLMQRTLSTTTGFNNVISNVGAMQNRGVEISIDAKLMRRKDISWSVSGNISTARNKVTRLYGDVTEIFNKGGFTGVEIQREGNLFLNQSLNSIYAYRFDRIAQESDMDFVSSLDLGGRIVRPGDILPKDIDENGIINDDDRVVVGIRDPKFYGGVTSDLMYKNFSINAVITYNYGAKRVSNLYESYMNGSGMSAAHEDMLNRWTPTNTNTNVPRAYNGGGRYGIWDVDLGVQDASFVRLSALTFAYNLPDEKLRKLKVQNVRVYITGSNLFLRTRYKGYDPEGGDGYPMSRMMVTGINIGF